MDIKSVYYPTQLDLKINLRPDQMMAGLDPVVVLLGNLKKAYEKKCNLDVFIINIKDIIEINDGTIDRNNCTGHALFNIKCNAYICAPTSEQYIVCKYLSKIPGTLFLENGPIKILVTDTDINMDDFKLNMEGDSITLIKQDKVLGLNDYLVVQITKTNYVRDKPDIIVGGKLIKMAGKKDIESFNKQQKLFNDPYIDSMTEDFI